MLQVIKLTTVSIITLVLYLGATFTGPSQILSEIRPVAINYKGYILCRTLFMENGMGASTLQKIEYGFCVLRDGIIEEHITRVLDPDKITDVDVFVKKMKVLDKRFKGPFWGSPDSSSPLGQKLVRKYGFSGSDLERFKVNKIVSLSSLSKRTNIRSNRQKALKGAKSSKYFTDKKVFIEYDFGNVLVLKNENEYTEEISPKRGTGADFDYYNPWTDEIGQEKNIGYDFVNVTGVLFLE